MDIEDYTPHFVEEKEDGCVRLNRKAYALMLVRVDECPICKKPMIYIPKDSYGLFPAYHKLQAKAQIERANWVKMSLIKQDDENVCEECVKAGKIIFLCYICEERKPTSKIQESIGLPPEYLCSDCYSTIPAKEWQKYYDKLEDDHKYDYG